MEMFIPWATAMAKGARLGKELAIPNAYFVSLIYLLEMDLSRFWQCNHALSSRF